MPASQLFSGSGDPNGVVDGHPGDLYQDQTAKLWLNVAAPSTWVQLSAAVPTTAAAHYFDDFISTPLVTKSGNATVGYNDTLQENTIGLVSLLIASEQFAFVGPVIDKTQPNTPEIQFFGFDPGTTLSLEWRLCATPIGNVDDPAFFLIGPNDKTDSGLSLPANMVGFVANADLNGDTAWWAYAIKDSTISKVSTGIDTSATSTNGPPQRFSVSAPFGGPTLTFSIGGVPVATLPSTNSPELRQLGISCYFASGSGDEHDVILDWVDFNMIIDRSA